MAKVLRINKKLPDTWQDALQDFLRWKQAQGVSKRTIEDYHLHITLFFRRFPDAWEADKLRHRVLEYMADPIMPATFNIRRVYLKAFFAWCVREGIFPENPFHDIPKKKDPGKIRYLSEEVLREFLTIPDRKTFSGLRDYTLLILTLATGIRPSEALALLPRDINLRGLSITIDRQVSKTRTERVIPIPPIVADAIRDLLAARHPEWKDTVPVFCSYSGKKLTTREYRVRLHIYARKLEQKGIKVNPYMLRHTFAIEAFRGGIDAFTIQRIMGHTDMNTTLRYVRLLESDVQEAMSKTNPLDRLLPETHRVKRVRKEKFRKP